MKNRFAGIWIGLAVGAFLPAGCTDAARIRQDLRSGATEGAFLEPVPFERQKGGLCGPNTLASLLGYWGHPTTQEEIGREIYSPSINGTLGFDLWRYARRSELAALQVPGGDLETVDLLLEHGVPVLMNLGVGELQHYVLVVAHDRGRGLWVIQDGLRPDRVVNRRWLEKRWEATGRWMLIAFPPDARIGGLGGNLHLAAASRAADHDELEAALFHLEEARVERPQDSHIRFRTGRVCAKLDRTEQAYRAYREAIRLAPDSPDAYNNLAMLLMEDPARRKEAEDLALRGVELSWSGEDPRMRLRLPYVLDTLGRILEKQGRTSEAKDAYTAALQAAVPDGALAGEIQRRLKTLAAGTTETIE